MNDQPSAPINSELLKAAANGTESDHPNPIWNMDSVLVKNGELISTDGKMSIKIKVPSLKVKGKKQCLIHRDLVS